MGFSGDYDPLSLVQGKSGRPVQTLGAVLGAGGLAVSLIGFVIPGGMVLALLFGVMLAVAALVLSIIGVARSGKKHEPRGAGVAGIVLAGLTIIVLPPLLGVLAWFKRDMDNWSRDVWESGKQREGTNPDEFSIPGGGNPLKLRLRSDLPDWRR